MTDSEIIKDLECLSGFAWKCGDCPYSPRYRFPLCQQQVAKDAISFINRQKAEIERLKEENNHFANIGKMDSKIKSEAITEFAARLKEESGYIDLYW